MAAAAHLAALVACDPAAALVLLAEGSDGVGRLSRDVFVRVAAAMVIVSRRHASGGVGGGGGVEEEEASVMEAVAPFAVQLFDALAAAAAYAGIGPGGAEPLLFYTYVTAALLSLSTAPDAPAWRLSLPFLLHDTAGTGYIDAPRLQEYVFAGVVAAALAAGIRAQAATDAGLTTRRTALGYRRSASPAAISLLAPSRRKDALLAAVSRGVWLDAAAAPPAVVVPPLVPPMTQALAVSMAVEARCIADGAIDDVRFGRFDSRAGGAAAAATSDGHSTWTPPVVTSLALASVTGIDDDGAAAPDASSYAMPTWRLSRDAYSAWLARSGVVQA